MSWKYSTGLRNALLEQNARVPHAVHNAAATMSFTADAGAGGESQILDSANGLGGFLGRAYITILGSTTNDGTYKILSVAAGEILLVAASLNTEAGVVAIILATSEGGSYRGIFRNGTIKIFVGSQPTSADDGGDTNEICHITLASGGFTGGLPGNGINFGQVASAVLHKETDAAGTDEVWSGLNKNGGGQAAWFRFYDNAAVTGASTTAIRLDGACATSGAQMNLTNTTLVDGVTTTIDQVALSMPAS